MMLVLMDNCIDDNDGDNSNNDIGDGGHCNIKTSTRGGLIHFCGKMLRMVMMCWLR